MYVMILILPVLLLAGVEGAECDATLMLQTRKESAAGGGTNRLVNATSDDCSRDMWDANLHTSPFQGALKVAFDQISQKISEAISSRYIPCKHVTISGGLFFEHNSTGRMHLDGEVGLPPRYTGPVGCGFFFMNLWRVEMLNGYDGGWNLIAFEEDKFLQNISEESKSNELQRLYNLVKIAAPLYVPDLVQQITFGDEKCDLPVFLEKMENAKTGADIYTLIHPRNFHKSLAAEIQWTKFRLHRRHELQPVFDDIERLQKYLGGDFLQDTYKMADIMCMTWTMSENVKTFARRWFWYTTTFTMRPQFTWNAALLDCGEALWVKYFEYIHPFFNVELVGHLK